MVFNRKFRIIFNINLIHKFKRVDARPAELTLIVTDEVPSVAENRDLSISRNWVFQKPVSMAIWLKMLVYLFLSKQSTFKAVHSLMRCQNVISFDLQKVR